MKQYRLNGIQWDIDPYDTANIGTLPSTASVWAKDESNAIDVLSHIYGFCVLSVDEIYEMP